LIVSFCGLDEVIIDEVRNETSKPLSPQSPSGVIQTNPMGKCVQIYLVVFSKEAIYTPKELSPTSFEVWLGWHVR